MTAIVLEQLLEWKHERNPYVDEPLMYLALNGGRVVGMRGMFGVKWQLDRSGRDLIGLAAGDLVIAPEHRNQGLFTQIMRVALDDLANRGYTYVFNLSASPFTHLSSLASGWRGIGSLKPVRRKGADGSLASASADAQNPFDSLDRQGEGSYCHPSVAVEPTPRPKEMAELVERAGDSGRLRHIRDPQYFAWRFQNPRSRYRFLFWGAERLEGYLVLRVSIQPERVRRAGVEIVDWEASSAGVRAGLLQAAIQGGRFDRLTTWSATLPAEVQTLLRDTGFRPIEGRGGLARFRPTVLVRPVRDEMLNGDWACAGRQLLDMRNWDLRMIYSDGQ